MKINVMLEPGAKMPTKAHNSDAGFDLYTPKEVYLPPRNYVAIDTGVHFEIPAGYVGFLKSKSGLNIKFDIHGEGVIDSGYTGTVVVKLVNDSGESHKFQEGEKIIQIVFLPIPDVTLVETDFLNNTERGNDGFGSSGRF